MHVRRVDVGEDGFGGGPCLEEVIHADVGFHKEQEALVLPSFLVEELLDQGEQFGFACFELAFVEPVFGQEILGFGACRSAETHQRFKVRQDGGVVALVARDPRVPKLGGAHDV